jgi:hypothetical protein
MVRLVNFAEARKWRKGAAKQAKKIRAHGADFSSGCFVAESAYSAAGGT